MPQPTITLKPTALQRTILTALLKYYRADKHGPGLTVGDIAKRIDATRRSTRAAIQSLTARLDPLHFPFVLVRRPGLPDRYKLLADQAAPGVRVRRDRLTTDQIQALAAVITPSFVYCATLARRLLAIQRDNPDLINLDPEDTGTNESGVSSYFRAHASPKGQALATAA